jgi:two-component system response regulator GlrR
VFIQGPTGAGKELVARAVHDLSGRHGDYVAVNMAAFNRGTMESQFFGHVKGAFTGAVSDLAGIFAQAHHGTLLLDEINSCPWDFQAKLLRVIEEGCVRAVGGRNDRDYDFRIIAASNATLEPSMRHHHLRDDLLHRLSGARIMVPALVDHLEDVPLLAAHFAKHANRGLSQPVQLRSDAIDALMAHDWPGNVRELKHLVQQLVVFSESPWVGASEVVAAIRMAEPSWASPAEDAERVLLREVLRRHNGNVHAAAAELQIDRSTLYRRCQRAQIRPSVFKAERTNSVEVVAHADMNPVARHGATVALYLATEIDFPECESS